MISPAYFADYGLPQIRHEIAGMDRNGLRPVIEPRALDDCGSMCAALIRARQAKVGPDLKAQIENFLPRPGSSAATDG